MSASTVSIIIIAWNSKAYLPACLNRLTSQTFQDFEVIIVDNGSQDEGTHNLQQKYPAPVLRIETLNTNLGFATANNIGARPARGRYNAHGHIMPAGYTLRFPAFEKTQFVTALGIICFLRRM